MRARSCALLVACLLGSGCGDSNGPPTTGGDEKGPRLVFAGQEVDTLGNVAQTALYVINMDGSGRTRLTEPRNWVGSPSWSPDGRKIAYLIGEYDIGVMNADGTNQSTVWHSTSGIVGPPSWSPDSRTFGLATGGGGIYVLNADGSDLRLIGNGSSPAWSPDGSRIAFVSLSPSTSIYTMKPDGTEATLLTDTSPATAEGLSWSPDGKDIAYRAVYAWYIGNHVADLEIFALDGSVTTKLPTSKYAAYPAWSPDGSLIAFADNVDYPPGIHLMNPDGTQTRPLTEAFLINGSISWGPMSGVQ